MNDIEADDPSLPLDDGENENGTHAGPTPVDAEQLRLTEALLFASADPMSEKRILARLPEGADIKALLRVLRTQYAGRGVNLIKAGQGWAFRTADDLGPLLERERAVTRKLSRAAVETLAIIAYHQPVTKAEIEEVRGVSLSSGTFDNLCDAGWVKPKGRKESPGHPMLWGTTDGFLDHFGLATLRDLPGRKDLAAMGLLDSGPALDAYRSRGDLAPPKGTSEEGERDENAPEFDLADDEHGADAEEQPLDPTDGTQQIDASSEENDASVEVSDETNEESPPW